MDSQRLSQEPLDSLIAPPDISLPTTPDPPHADIPQGTALAVNKAQAARVEDATAGNMTPPPSTQVPPSNRTKTRTPTPPVSHISTPPPTVEGAAPSQGSRIGGAIVASMTDADLDAATPEDLKKKITELQAAMHEAKMSAAHHKLQYQMLSQESRAAIERMTVEARMAQTENDVIQHAEQARAAATPAQPSHQDGIIPVHRDLYQRMIRDIHLLREANAEWKAECDRRDAIVERQDNEIASLTDKVTLMRERIRDNRDHLQRYRMRHAPSSRVDATPRSTYYGTPHRGHASSQAQSQPFAALLQASEMASQESARAGGRGTSSKNPGHVRNTHSTSSLPSTPQRVQKVPSSTPQGRNQPLKIPSTAPMPRTSALRTPDVYKQPSLPVSQTSQPAAPQSEGTVSASDREEENDSEAETDILEPDVEVGQSQASLRASQMLRSSQEERHVKASSQARGMLKETGGENLRQTKLFGTVRKANVDRSQEPPAKRARTGESAVGLGIAGVRH
ncbi:Hypothetical predicted protein [Lecanosticta acicola]|uniref:Uncharacterized protein n=1 Tax=Lecanosticta acicola TaxID=111012 RepID=A0AAI8YVA3_9PEZI|nr:Hypothetical predicted protein [Lecanosticta acicola]